MAMPGRRKTGIPQRRLMDAVKEDLRVMHVKVHNYVCFNVHKQSFYSAL